MVSDGRGAYVKELAEYLKQRFARQKAMIRNTRQLRALLHEVAVPVAYRKTAQVVRTPLLADMVMRITATLSVNYPSWHAVPLGDTGSDKAQEISSLKEKWLAAAHRRMEKEAYRRIFRMGMSAAIGDGMAVWQWAYKPTAYPYLRRRADEQVEVDGGPKRYTDRVAETYQKAAFPFSWNDVDPLNYYYHETEDHRREIVICKTLPLKPTLRTLGVRREGGRWVDAGTALPGDDVGSTGETIELTEWHGPKETAFCLDNEPAKVVKHSVERPGFFHFAGLSSHENAPERAFLPVCFAFEHLLPLLDRLLTMKANWMYLAAFPTPFRKIKQVLQETLDMAPDDRKDVPVDFGGELLTIEPDEEVGYVSPPPIGADLNQMIQLVMQMIEVAGIGNVMRGQGIGADASGYLANQLMTAARLAYDPITDNARFALEQGAEWMFETIDKEHRRGVYVWGEKLGNRGEGEDWLQLGHEEINGFYSVGCKLEPLLPSNFIMEGRFGLEQWKAGAIPLKYHQEQFLHVEQPEELERQGLIEAFKHSPQVQQILMSRIVAKAKLKQLLPEEPPPNPLAGMVGPDGRTPLSELGNAGMPVTPGQGMPIDQGDVQREGVPSLPGAGANPAMGPGGQFGRRVVPNV